MDKTKNTVLANCFLIGSPKSGTTSLAETLSHHPEICLVNDKEPRFFSHDNNYSKGYEEYHRLFEANDKHKIFIDASTTYSEYFLERYRKASQRIFNYNSEAKIIYLVRHPYKRLISNWVDYIIADKDTERKYEVFKKGELILTGNINVDIKSNKGIYETSNYLKIVSSYEEYFKNNQILVLFFEDLIKNPNIELNKIFNFLDVKSNDKVAYGHQNKTTGKSVSNSLGKFLRKLPLYQGIVKITPSKMKNKLQGLIKQQVFIEKPKLDNETIYFLDDKLKSETQGFLTKYGKKNSFWDLEDFTSRI